MAPRSAIDTDVLSDLVNTTEVEKMTAPHAKKAINICCFLGT